MECTSGYVPAPDECKYTWHDTPSTSGLSTSTNSWSTFVCLSVKTVCYHGRCTLLSTAVKDKIRQANVKFRIESAAPTHALPLSIPASINKAQLMQTSLPNITLLLSHKDQFLSRLSLNMWLECKAILFLFTILVLSSYSQWSI